MIVCVGHETNTLHYFKFISFRGASFFGLAKKLSKQNKTKQIVTLDRLRKKEKKNVVALIARDCRHNKKSKKKIEKRFRPTFLSNIP